MKLPLGFKTLSDGISQGPNDDLYAYYLNVSSTSLLQLLITSSGGFHMSPFAVIMASIVPVQGNLKSIRTRELGVLTFVNCNIKSCIIKLQVTDIHFMP